MLLAASLSLGLLSFVSAKTIDIQVGGSSLVFTPEAVFADPGDQLVFHFGIKNHSVTQSSLANPCGPKPGGFDSGFMPVTNSSSSPTFTVSILDTSPTWVFCNQFANTANSHCGKGMVFAANCGSNGAANSFTNFKNAALAIGASLAGTPTSTAVSGSATPPPDSGSVVTATVTLQSSTWTTTYTSYPGSPDPTPSSLTGNVIKVVVGGPNKLAFNPPFVAAKPRDIVQFEFLQKNHSATQSTFGAPCKPATINGVVGFDTGFMPVGENATTFPTYNLTINDTAPVWVYCRQANHCGSGMVFAVNPVQNSARNFSAFQGLAMALNGTSSAANPSATSSSSSDATALSVGGAGLTLALGALLATLL